MKARVSSVPVRSKLCGSHLWCDFSVVHLLRSDCGGI